MKASQQRAMERAQSQAYAVMTYESTLCGPNGQTRIERIAPAWIWHADLPYAASLNERHGVQLLTLRTEHGWATAELPYGSEFAGAVTNGAGHLMLIGLSVRGVVRMYGVGVSCRACALAPLPAAYVPEMFIRGRDNRIPAPQMIA